MTDSPAAEPRLVSPWLLAALAILVLLMLALARPEMGRMARDLVSGKPSDLSISYLDAWLRVQPDSPRLQEILARQYLGLGRWDDAYRAAVRLDAIGDATTRQAAMRLQVRAVAQKTFEHPVSDPERTVQKSRLIKLLHDLAGRDMDVPTMAYLAGTAYSIGAGDVSLVLYRRLARTDVPRAGQWYATLGQVAQSSGQYELAAQAYFSAQQRSGSLSGQRENFLAALRALESGNQADRACDLAEKYLGALADDPHVLRFLIRLAEQAGRADMVRHYGRALARQLALGPRYLDGERGAILSGWMPSGNLYRVADAPVGQTPAQVRTHEDYELLYRVFVESGSLQDAMDIAQRALRKPFLDRRVWLPRLAQVAEWDGQPKTALAAWFAAGREFDDAAAWGRVLRMAPQLGDDAMYLQALLHAPPQSLPEGVDLVTEVVAAYERLGDPEEGLGYLKQQLGHGQDRHVLELQAALALRAGDDALSLDTWKQLQRRYGPDPSYALHEAALLYAHGQPQDALQSLRQAQAAAAGHAAPADFWDSYVGLARLLGDDADVQRGMRGQLAQGRADKDDFAGMLYFYSGHPIDVGRVAEAAYRRTGSLADLQLAIESYHQVHAWSRIGMLLTNLNASQQTAFEASSGLLEARAAYRQATGQPAAALNDLRRAYRLPGSQPGTGISYLWALLADGDLDSVRTVAGDLARRHGSEPEYASVLAAASLQLGRPRQALRYMDLEGVRDRQDPLWLITYADAREAVGQPEMAWRIRRQAWRLLLQRRESQGGSQDERDALISLAQTYRAGDVSLGLLIRRLREGAPDTLKRAVARSLLGDTPGVPRLASLSPAEASSGVDHVRHVDAAARALVLAWAMSGEHQALARAWLADRYVADMLKPDNVRLALALQDDDRAALADVLTRNAAALTSDARIQALDRLHRVPEAQSLAFETFEQAPDHDEHAEVWRDVAMRHRPSAGLAMDFSSVGDLKTRSAILDAGLALASGLRLKVQRIDRWYASRDDSTLPGVPARDRSSSLSLLHAGRDHDDALQLGWRQGLSAFGMARASTDWVLSDYWRVSASAGVNQDTDITSIMTVGGSRDFGSLGLSWDSQHDWFANGSVEMDRYRAQGGATVGTGRGFLGTVGYHLRMDGPPLNLETRFSHWNYAARAGPVPELARMMPDQKVPDAADLMPADSRQYGLALTLGDERRDRYQRGWRPFLELSWMHDRQQGWGLGVLGGLGGSVLGRDRLGIYALHEAAGQGGGQPTTRVGLFYRLFY
ncbi:tetratricopeptide repeat protein [Castellaniella sp. MT123]|uniref:tetratricopeptide repeat protein n=1 Tax=Castellaniella sp. MT123 TaxID=3140381 RepID=UPI0031F3C824